MNKTITNDNKLDLTSITVSDTAVFEGQVSITDTTNSTSSTTGALTVGGGVGIAGTAYIDGVVTVNDQLKINSVGGTDNNNFSIIIGNSLTGSSMTTSTDCILIGAKAGEKITAGGNIAIGVESLKLNVSGSFNTAIGDLALSKATTGFSVAVGRQAGVNLTSGGGVFIGNKAGETVTTGDGVFVGGGSDGSAGGTKQTCLGSTSMCAGDNQTSLGYGATCDLDNQTTIGNVSMAIIRPGGDNVCDLGESDRQFKDLYLGSLILSKSNVTQITSIFTSVTVSGNSGIITTLSSTLAAEGKIVIPVITGTDTTAKQVMVTINNYTGTGGPVLTVKDKSATGFDIVIFNAHSTAALNSNLEINYLII